MTSLVDKQHISTVPDRNAVEERQLLDHVLWLGGSPCSGKTAIANLLARKHGLAVYHVDEAFDRHREAVPVDEQPCLFTWTHTDWDALWMQPVDRLVLPHMVMPLLAAGGSPLEIVSRRMIG